MLCKKYVIMAYDKKKLFNQTLEVAKSCFTIEEVIAGLPCDKTTYYALYPIDSNENNTIKGIIEENKTATKQKMKKRWIDSDNPTLQLSAFKLIATDEERKALSMTHSDVTSNGQTIKVTLPNFGE